MTASQAKRIALWIIWFRAVKGPWYQKGVCSGGRLEAENMAKANVPKGTTWRVNGIMP